MTEEPTLLNEEEVEVSAEEEEDPIDKSVPCNSDLFLEEIADQTIFDGEMVEIVLLDTSNGDCKFTLELLDQDSGQKASGELFKLEQAKFISIATEENSQWNKRYQVARAPFIRI